MAKVPPPPRLAGPEWEDFNRWLLELTNILDATGGVDPTQIPGYSALQSQVATNTQNITTNSLNITSLANGQGTQGTSIASLQNRMTAAEGNITTLQARNQVFNGALGGTGTPPTGTGVVGDWYANTNGNAGFRIFIKTASATWTAFAF